MQSIHLENEQKILVSEGLVERGSKDWQLE